MPKSNQKKIDVFWFFCGLTIVLWVCSFWIFLSYQAQLVTDAVSFYDHLKFYIDNIVQGIYPSWDSLWNCGAPNEFFLRRIGVFNPLLLLIIIPYKLGLAYWTAFAVFLTFYFFLGMVGFYRLVLEVVKDKKLAILAFVFLSFSSLGTRVFDSYMMMILTPMIWFFYFSFVFGRSGQRSALLGMVFCTMLLMTTYIPFYFLVLVLSFLIFFVLIFPKAAGCFVARLWRFFQCYPWLTLICLLALAVSCLPGMMFFKSAAQGDFSMPLRHFAATDPHILTVQTEVITYWAIPEDLMYSSFYLEDLRLFDFAVFYVPLFAMILLLLGMVTRINRKVFFIFLWGSFLLIMGSPYVLPLYDILYQSIFFFKYFRNLHFFLWFAILPLMIIFVVEQMRLFLKMMDDQPRRKFYNLVFIILVHLALAVFLVWRQSFNYSTWAVVVVSLVFFISYWYQRLPGWLICAVCFFAAVIQPLEVYQHLQQNTEKSIYVSPYDQLPREFEYTRGQKSKLADEDVALSEQSPQLNSPLYFGTQWYNFLWNNMDARILKNYVFNKFVLYDHIAPFDEQKDDLKVVARNWAKNLNTAFVTKKDFIDRDYGDSQQQAIRIEQSQPYLNVVQVNTNRIRITTHLLTTKFLVFNDCYYPGWRAFINGQETPLYRANIAFKGIWVPPGEQNIEFTFGNFNSNQRDVFIMIFYFVFFILFLWLWHKDSLFMDEPNA
ncbi:MAG: YfhO family protein [Candidatus Omnitrophica bacterium]|nr:YfhO family protein [Candidatus Omnitrophota bacterium]